MFQQSVSLHFSESVTKGRRFYEDFVDQIGKDASPGPMLDKEIWSLPYVSWTFASKLA